MAHGGEAAKLHVRHQTGRIRCGVGKEAAELPVHIRLESNNRGKDQNGKLPLHRVFLKSCQFEAKGWCLNVLFHN